MGEGEDGTAEQTFIVEIAKSADNKTSFSVHFDEAETFRDEAGKEVVHRKLPKMTKNWERRLWISKWNLEMLQIGG